MKKLLLALLFCANVFGSGGTSLGGGAVPETDPFALYKDGSVTATGAFNWGTQNLTNVGLLGLTSMTVSSAAATSLTADNQSVSTSGVTHVKLSSNSVDPSLRTITLTQGTAGQHLYLETTSASPNMWELVDDSANTGGTGNVRLSGTYGDFIGTQYRVLHLISDGTDWIEVDRSVPIVDPRNLIMNGNFEFWQRGTTFTTAADNTTTADRFKYMKAGTTATHTIVQDGDGPSFEQTGGFANDWALRLNTVGGDGSMDAGDIIRLRYAFEGYEYVGMKTRTFTLSFWVKSGKTGIHCVSFQNSGSDRSYVVEYTINAANTWEKKVIPVTLNQSGGTNHYQQNIGFSISWAIMGGSNYRTTAGSWQNGNYFVTINQVNGVGESYRFAQIQLNAGPVQAPFNRYGVTMDGELRALQRYYEKSYNVAVDPGTASVPEGAFSWYNAADSVHNVPFMGVKRSNPTMAFYNPTTGVVSEIRNITGAADIASGAFGNIGHHGAYFDSGSATAADMMIHWTADSEI